MLIALGQASAPSKPEKDRQEVIMDRQTKPKKNPNLTVEKSLLTQFENVQTAV